VQQEIFVVQAWAMATEATTRVPGQRHAQLVLVSAGSIGEAEEIARSRLADSGWQFATVIRSKLLSADIELIEDDALRGAAKSAMDHGCAIVTYQTPLPPDA
jgi:hypothetical protein